MWGIYKRELGGYRVAATKELIHNSGGVILVYHEAQHSTLETLCLHGPNDVNFHLVMSGNVWHVVGFYIYHNNALTIEDVVADISINP